MASDRVPIGGQMLGLGLGAPQGLGAHGATLASQSQIAAVLIVGKTLDEIQDSDKSSIGGADTRAALIAQGSALLAGEEAGDVSAEAIRSVTSALSSAAPALRAEPPNAETARALLTPTQGSPQQHAALQALTLLLGRLREARQDPMQLLREVTP